MELKCFRYRDLRTEFFNFALSKILTPITYFKILHYAFTI